MSMLFEISHDFMGDRSRVGVERFTIWDRRAGTAPLDTAYVPNGYYDIDEPGVADRLAEAVAVVRFEYNRRKWPDLMWNTVGTFPWIVSDRVHKALIDEKIERFIAVPLERAADDPGWTKAEMPPKYWGLYSALGLETRHGRRARTPVRIDGPAAAEEMRKRFMPVPGSWNGKDLFVLSQHLTAKNTLTGASERHTYYRFGCTERVVNLAHVHKWVGFSFWPVDARLDFRTPVEHLKKRWPPKSWYGDSPGTGKSFEEWLKINQDPKAHWEERRNANLAIRYDFSDIAAPYFVEKFAKATIEDRLRYAGWIGALENLVGTYKFPPGVLEEAKALLKADYERRYPGQSA